MQRLITSLKFVNSKCDNVRFYCAWMVTQKLLVIKKMKAFGKF